MAFTNWATSDLITAAKLNNDNSVSVGTDTARTITVTHTWTASQTLTGGWTAAAACAITAASATAFAVGRQGTTDPVLLVHSSTASQATGIKITGAAAAGGVAVAAISSGTNESMTLDAKGSGTITVAGTSTGAVIIARSTTVGSSTASAGSYTFDVNTPTDGGSAMRIGPKDADTGGWITSEVANNLSFSSGSAMNAAGSWIAKHTDAAQIHMGGGNVEFFVNTGLVAGNSFAPTLIGYFSANQFLLVDGNAALPAVAGKNYVETGMYFGSSALAFAVDGANVCTMTPSGISAAAGLTITSTVTTAVTGRGPAGGNAGSLKAIGNRTSYGDITAQFLSTAGGSTTLDGCTISTDSGFISLSTGGQADALKLVHGGAATFASSVTTGAPTGGAGAWKLGVASVTSPTSPNRTVAIDIGGTVYYLHAKTTND